MLEASLDMEKEKREIRNPMLYPFELRARVELTCWICVTSLSAASSRWPNLRHVLRTTFAIELSNVSSAAMECFGRDLI